MVFLTFGTEGMPWQIFRQCYRFGQLEIGVFGQCGDGQPKLIGQLPDAVGLFVDCRFLERPIPINLKKSVELATARISSMVFADWF